MFAEQKSTSFPRKFAPTQERHPFEVFITKRAIVHFTASTERSEANSSEIAPNLDCSVAFVRKNEEAQYTFENLLYSNGYGIITVVYGVA